MSRISGQFDVRFLSLSNQYKDLNLIYLELVHEYHELVGLGGHERAGGQGPQSGGELAPSVQVCVLTAVKGTLQQGRGYGFCQIRIRGSVHRTKGDF